MEVACTSVTKQLSVGSRRVPSVAMDPVVEVVAAPPHPALRPFVDRYVGYRLDGFPAGVHRGLPGRHLTFIVSLGSPIDVTVMPACAPRG